MVLLIPKHYSTVLGMVWEAGGKGPQTFQAEDTPEFCIPG